MSVVIFSIDLDNENPRKALDNFLEWCIKHELQGSMKPLIGCYKGKEEPAFITDREVWDQFIHDSPFVTHQESILTVTTCNKAYAHLEFLADHDVQYLGSMCEVPEHVARSYDAWTFRPDMGDKGAWYIAHPTNPDHSYDIPVNPDL